MIDVDNILRIEKRRLDLCRKMNEQELRCPAQWKCSHCKYKFEWEGE